MFSAKSGIRHVFTTQNPLFEENTDFRFHCLFAKIHHAQGGKGFYFFEIPIWERLLFFGDSHFEKPCRVPPRGVFFGAFLMTCGEPGATFSEC